MAKNYFTSEFEDANGYWHCVNDSDLANDSNVWWHLPRFLGLPLDEYVKMLVEKFNVSKIDYRPSANLLLFSWSEQKDMRKFKNWANKEYRNRR